MRLYLYDMRNALYIVILFFPLLTFAQPMEFQPAGIPVDYQGWNLMLPWMGGTTEPKLDFVDLDNDGDKDMIIGDSHGKIWYINNAGDVSLPSWEVMPSFFLDSIDVHSHACPALGDIDADGDYDLFISSSYHWKLWYYENLGNSIFPYFYLIDDSLEEVPWIRNVAISDVDMDNDIDLFASWGGILQYYANVGGIYDFAFVKIDSPVANTNVGGKAKPYVGDLNDDNLKDLVIGSESGNIWYLRNDGTASQYNFTVVTQNLVGDVGSDAAPTLADIDGDGDLDLFVGVGTTSFGGIRYFENIGTPEVYDFQMITDNYFCIDFGIWSVPRLVDIDADEDFDLFLSRSSKFAFYENTGFSQEPEFLFIDDNYQGIYPGYYGSIDFADLDADSDYDLLIGFYDGDWSYVSLYENTGTVFNPQFSLVNSNLLGQITDTEIRLSLCDINNDNDYDLFIGDGYGHIHYYSNIGNASQFHFNLVTTNYLNIDVGYMASPYFYDIDADGDYDMFIGYNLGTDPSPVGIRFYENTGSPTNAIFTYITQYWGDVTIHSTSSTPCFADINDDGDGDLFIGSYDGGVAFYRNLYYNNSVSDPSDHIPTEFSLREAYPNPFNSKTAISYQLQADSYVELVVYDVLGREVAVLLNQQLSSGSYQLNWNAEGYSSGCYFLRLQAEGAFQTKKIILIE